MQNAGAGTYLNGGLGEPDLGHCIQRALGLGACDALQRAERLVQLDGAPLQAIQQRLLLLCIQLVRGLSLLHATNSGFSV